MEKAEAYVLVTVKHGTARKIAEEINKIEPVEKVNILFGQYDIITNIKCSDSRELRAIVDERIGNMEGVERTETLVVADMPL